jgi:putative NADPH-quinone reductase
MPSHTTSPRVLIVFAHAMPHTSRVNRAMIAAARGLPNVVVQDLYETYPDFHIDVPHEQALLEAADLIVFQHPIQWYGMPSLLKEWVDVVLESGWAYGQGGTALKGKHYLLSVTTGSTVDAYHEAGLHNWPFGAFLPPFRQTAQLCGMHWMPPLILHGAHQVPQAEVDAHVARFLDVLSVWPTTGAPSADAAMSPTRRTRGAPE